MCHVIFAVPFVSLVFFGMLPPVEAAALYALLNVPVFLLSGHIWKVHRRPPLTGWEGMLGLRAVAETPLQPRGLVRCKGELWRAQASAPVQAGGLMRVLAVQGMELQVEPLKAGASGGVTMRSPGGPGHGTR